MDSYANMDFAAAEKVAESVPDIMRYSAWCNYMELRNNNLGPAWATDANRHRMYAGYVAGKLRWLESQPRGTGMQPFFDKLKV